MKQRLLGTQGLSVSAMGLGCMGMNTACGAALANGIAKNEWLGWIAKFLVGAELKILVVIALYFDVTSCFVLKKSMTAFELIFTVFKKTPIFFS